MRHLDEVVRVVHASKNWHGLDGDHELGELHVAIEVLRELCQKSQDYAKANVINESNEHHADVPPKLMSIVMVKLKVSREKVSKYI